MSVTISTINDQLDSDHRRSTILQRSPLRILVHDYAGHPFQVQLSRELARHGHEVLHAFAGALQTPRGELIRREVDPECFEIREVPMDVNYQRHKYSFTRRRGMEIRYGREAARLVGSWKPQLVLSANTPTEAQAAILNASQSLGARFVYWLQDFYSLAVTKLARRKVPLLGPLIGAYYRGLDRQQFRRSDHIVAITRDFVPLLCSQFGVAASKISTIPNWAPLDSLPAGPKANRWSQSLELADKFVFLYTGTLGMKHNPALLSQLAKRYRHDAGVRIVVVSEGIGIDWLEEEKKRAQLENLVLLPYQPFDQMPEVLATGDILIGVLEEEAGIFSVPSKVLTYLCAQRALLLAVPEVNLAARLIREQDAGLIVPPVDDQRFLEAAERLRCDATLRASQARNARNYAERTFKIAEIAERFELAFAD